MGGGGGRGERERGRERGEGSYVTFSTVLSLASTVAGPEGFILNLQVLNLKPLLPL